MTFFATSAHADQNASKAMCKLKCSSSKKASDAAVKALEDFLQDVEQGKGAYKKELDKLMGYRKNLEKKDVREHSSLEIRLEKDPRNNLPNFFRDIVNKAVRKKSNLDFCFSACGFFRQRAFKTIDFMYPYFVKVLAHLGKKNIKKLGLYSVAPFNLPSTYELMDHAARKVKQQDFDRILQEKSQDDEIRDHLNKVRTNNATFATKDFGATKIKTLAELDLEVKESEKLRKKLEKELADKKIDKKTYYKEEFRLLNPDMDPEILEKAFPKHWEGIEHLLKIEEKEAKKLMEQKKLDAQLKNGDIDLKAYTKAMDRLDFPDQSDEEFDMNFPNIWRYVEAERKKEESEYRENNKNLDPKLVEKEVLKIWRRTREEQNQAMIEKFAREQKISNPVA